MRVMLALDDDLLAEARKHTGIDDFRILIREALHALVEREARRLARPAALLDFPELPPLQPV